MRKIRPIFRNLSRGELRPIVQDETAQYRNLRSLSVTPNGFENATLTVALVRVKCSTKGGY
jgi:hypothetical protein